MQPHSTDLIARYRERNIRVAIVGLGFGSAVMVPGFVWMLGNHPRLLPLLVSLMILQMAAALGLVYLLQHQAFNMAGAIVTGVMIAGGCGFLLAGQQFAQITLAMYMLAIMVGNVVLESHLRRYVLMACLAIFALLLLATNLLGLANTSPVTRTLGVLNLPNTLRIASTAWLSHLILLTATHFVLGQLGRELQAKLLVEQRARAEAEANSRLKSEFLANITHELKTPLNGVIGSASQLQLGLIEDDDRDDALAEIITTGQQLLSLINDLLNFGKYTSGRVQLAYTQIAPCEFLARVVGTFQMRAAGQGISLQLAAEDLPPTIATDPVRLRQILNNLLDNALKFTPTGSVTVSADVVADTWSIQIQDTGIGISDAALPHIFEEFRQGDGSTTRAFGGTGLGLAVVNTLVQEFGGTIQVESVLGAGSTFIVNLPQKGVTVEEETA